MTEVSHLNAQQMCVRVCVESVWGGGVVLLSLCLAWMPMGNDIIWKNRSLWMFVTVSFYKKDWVRSNEDVLFMFLALCLQANPNELTNGVINSAFMLLFKDSIRLFAAYNEGVINLLGSGHFSL